MCNMAYINMSRHEYNAHSTCKPKKLPHWEFKDKRQNGRLPSLKKPVMHVHTCTIPAPKGMQMHIHGYGCKCAHTSIPEDKQYNTRCTCKQKVKMATMSGLQKPVTHRYTYTMPVPGCTQAHAHSTGAQYKAPCIRHLQTKVKMAALSSQDET